MTTTMVRDRPPKRAHRRARALHRSPEALAFSGAAAVALLHAVDDAFLHRQPGVGIGQHALVAALSVVLALGAIFVFPTVRPALRSAVAFLFGSLAIVNGMLHIKHIADQGAAASDVTGALAAAAGAVLIGLAVAIPWQHRGEGAASRRRRWTYRVLALPVGLLAAFYTVLPMGLALTETHKFRESIGAPPSADYREVAFEASDGVQLSGWYRPTRNGATILLVHGAGGDRTGALAHAKLLARHGYGVLLYDARGRGRSEGVQNAWGTDLKAVVADGTYAGSLADGQRIAGFSAITPFMAVEFATVGVTSGTTPGPAIEDMMKRITSPLLLVAAGAPERDAAEVYDRAAGNRPVDVWYLRDVRHTAAIREAGPQYERRVTGFFDAALSGVDHTLPR